MSLLEVWLFKHPLSSFGPLRILTPLLHACFGMALQQGFPCNEVGHRDAPDNTRSGGRRARAGQVGPWGRVVSDTQQSSIPQSNMSEIGRYGRLCVARSADYPDEGVPEERSFCEKFICDPP